MIILIIGLSGSGKSTLADKLSKRLGYPRLNADEVRAEANDWDFSPAGRTRQAQRIAIKAHQYPNVIVDLIAPLPLHRVIIKADKVIWMNTVQESRFKDTDKIFEPPKNADIIVTDYNYSIENLVQRLTAGPNSGKYLEKTGIRHRNESRLD